MRGLSLLLALLMTQPSFAQSAPTPAVAATIAYLENETTSVEVLDQLLAEKLNLKANLEALTLGIQQANVSPQHKRDRLNALLAEIERRAEEVEGTSYGYALAFGMGSGVVMGQQTHSLVGIAVSATIVALIGAGLIGLSRLIFASNKRKLAKEYQKIAARCESALENLK